MTVTELGAFSKSRTCGIAGEAHAEMFAASPVIEEADTPERQVKARRSDVDLWIEGSREVEGHGASRGVPTAMTPRPGAPRQQGCLTSLNATLSEADGVVVSAGAGARQPSLVEGGRPEAGARSNAGGVRKRERGEAPASCTSALEVADAAGADAKTEVAVPRRSGRVAARTDEQRVRSRIVTGRERVDDVAADEARRIVERRPPRRRAKE